MIYTWICQFCGWLNDNKSTSLPCRKCGAK